MGCITKHERSYSPALRCLPWKTICISLFASVPPTTRRTFACDYHRLPASQPNHWKSTWFIAVRNMWTGQTCDLHQKSGMNNTHECNKWKQRRQYYPVEATPFWRVLGLWVPGTYAHTSYVGWRATSSRRSLTHLLDSVSSRVTRKRHMSIDPQRTYTKLMHLPYVTTI